MAEYVCPRCNYFTNQVYNFKKHLLRKNTCQPEINDIPVEDILKQFERTEADGYVFKCDYCPKQFKTKQCCNQHKHRCRNKLASDQRVEDKLGKLEDEINSLKQQLTVKQPQSNQVVNNVNNNTDNSVHNVVNQVIINVKSFGQENLSYIEKDKQFLTSCLMSRDIRSLIESIHCDREHPENHNVRIKSTKQELMETFVDGGWIISDQEETLDELLNKGYRVLKFHSHRNKRDIKAECDDDDDEYDSLMEWLENVYDDKKLRKPIKRQLLILFMNRRTMLLEKEVD